MLHDILLFFSVTLQQPRNPCKLVSSQLCAPYQCFRDANNRLTGYSCACPPGMRSASHASPRCVNINECNELTNPCLNGGVCVDRQAPSANTPRIAGQPYGYACLCRYGYSGARCERPPPSLYWSGWSLWSGCSASCGVGTYTRYRTCPVRNRCVGRSIETGRCLGPVTHCVDAVGDASVVPYGLGSKIVQGWGIGWTPEDDRTLSDAFFWSETEDGWPRLYFRKEGFHFADILTWTKLTQLSRQWSLTQLMIYHAVVLGLVTLPLLMIFLALSKMIQKSLRRRRPAQSLVETSSDEKN
ncbi:Thrombospondin type 1 domain protein [Paragonimus heterotremus]|uniref:Thrombospondin type 1 domain protein n=1 Tax=Paragonimus heterotremus TaxID=100268 RepID=A0A8J4SFE3_9TREM|nr:Thrombospondin type 1 domain protein [Paragonimus heterotremus]